MYLVFDCSKLESRIETLEECLRDKAKMLNFMFDENNNPCHTMHHHCTTHVASGLSTFQSLELITPDIPGSYSSNIAGLVRQLVLKCIY